MRFGRALPLLLLLAFFATLQSHASDLALVGAKIYLSPSDPPIESGTILVHRGQILSVGSIAEIKVPRGTIVIDCKGLVVTAGFWNSHVHILLPALIHAEKLSSEELTSQLQQMLTRWGFTSVFDIASVLQNTNLIRRRIEDGEVKGPRILTVGEPFWGKGGTPIYIKGSSKPITSTFRRWNQLRGQRSECASRFATARMALRFLRIPWSAMTS
jgi:imidazolonepropionase-like amidohydrolase